jgi:hypothetical protein
MLVLVSADLKRLLHILSSISLLQSHCCRSHGGLTSGYPFQHHTYGHCVELVHVSPPSIFELFQKFLLV